MLQKIFLQPAGHSVARAVNLEKRLWALALAMSVLILGVLATPLFMGEVYVQDDLGIFHLSARYFYAQSLTHGESFIWWPSVLGGYYLHGEGQAGLYHPVHLLLYRLLPFVMAFNIELLLHYPFMLAGTYLFFRRWDLRSDAAMFGAMVFTFAGFNLLHFIHPNIVAVIAHTPWLLLAIEEAMCGSDPRRVSWAKFSVGLLTTSQLLLGHPQAVWFSGVLEVLYLGWRFPDWQGTTRLWSLGIAKVLGILGGSVQLLPTWDAVVQSMRQETPYVTAYRYRDSLNPINLAQFVAPYVAKTRVFGSRFVNEFGIYSGAIAAAVPLWLLIRRKVLTARRWPVMSVLCLALLGLVLAMGRYGYVYRLQTYLPLVNWFGVPVRYIFLLQFALAVGAAFLFSDLATIVQSRTPIPRRQFWTLTALPVISVGVIGAAIWVRSHPMAWPALAAQLATPERILLASVPIVLATTLILVAARGSPYALAGIVVFAAIDQGIYGVSFLWDPFRSSPFETVSAAQALPPETTSYRVQSDNNFLTLRGFQLAGGYIAFRPRPLMNPLNVKRLQLAGVEWVQTRAPWTRTDTSLELDPLLARDTRVTFDGLGNPSSWAHVSNPMARARLVTQSRVSVAPAQDLDSINITATALVPEALRLEEGPVGRVSIEFDKPGHIRLRAAVPSRQLLSLTESWHDGWRASVDGVPRDVVRVNGDFLGCVVEAGQHSVEFSFQPESLRRGAWLSGLGLTLLLLVHFQALVRYSVASSKHEVSTYAQA